MTKVVNIRNENYDVYIGWSGKEQDGYFGNHLEEVKCNQGQLH